MSVARVAATLLRTGTAVAVVPPRTGVLDVASGRVVGRAPEARRVPAVDYPDRAPDGRTATNGTPSRVRRWLLAAVDADGVALEPPLGWTLTDAGGADWTLESVDAYTRAGTVLAYECRGIGR